MIKNLPTSVGDVGLIPVWEDPLEKGMATHSSILVWEIPWTEELGRLQSMRLHKRKKAKMSWEKEVMECLGFLRRKACSHLSLSATHLFPRVFFSYVSCLPYLCQLQGSWNLVSIVQHGREPRSSWESFCRHTSESQNHSLSGGFLPSQGMCPLLGRSTYFYIFTAFYLFLFTQHPRLF